MNALKICICIIFHGNTWVAVRKNTVTSLASDHSALPRPTFSQMAQFDWLLSDSNCNPLNEELMRCTLFLIASFLIFGLGESIKSGRVIRLKSKLHKSLVLKSSCKSSYLWLESKSCDWSPHLCQILTVTFDFDLPPPCSGTHYSISVSHMSVELVQFVS